MATILNKIDLYLTEKNDNHKLHQAANKNKRSSTNKTCGSCGASIGEKSLELYSPKEKKFTGVCRKCYNQYK